MFGFYLEAIRSTPLQSN